MLEAVFLIAACALLLWIPFPWSTVSALTLLLLALPGALAMRSAAPFVATPKATVSAMLTLAAIQPGDRAYDLGCGDGRLVFAAAKLGAIATGYELSVPAYLVANIRSYFHARSTIRYGDLWRQDYRNADVLFCYFLRDTMQDFQRRIWPTLKPGCRVVSHAFTMHNVKPTGRDGDAVLYVKHN